MLDKPNAPFDVKMQPTVLLMIIGFIIGCILGAIVLGGGLVYRYGKDEIYKSIFGK
jgi:hypothetical protein